jgi:ADP-dependent NAD(P)H-hydrate dehydratase / NAD(P)H-hydrate epimerase
MAQRQASGRPLEAAVFVIIRTVQPVLSADQMRQIDRLTTEHYSVPSLLLMEAAANACLKAISERLGALTDKKIIVLCGPGNNGGDGAALARALAGAGAHADVILFGKVENTKGDARTNFEAIRRLASFEAGSSAGPPPVSFLECDSLQLWEEVARPRTSYDVVVDALFGTGLTRPLQGIYLQVIQHLEMLRRARERAHGARPLIVSIDIPSGLDADRANPIGETVRADLTVTFTSPKPANVLPPACYFGGELTVAEIGSPATLVEAADSKLFATQAEDARRWLELTRYTPESYKNTHGHALIIAGSRDYSGAAALAGNAAMRSGAGLVTIATPVAAQVAVASRAMPEVITTALRETDLGTVSDEALDHVKSLAARCNAVAIGPGLTDKDERTRKFVRSVIDTRTTPLVIDADGLNCIAPWPGELKGSQEHPLILTPHPGEMLRLLGSDEKSALSDRVETARKFAVEHELILVLKGSRTLIAGADGRVFVNPTGNAGMGTAGAGDTLTGVITGFLAQASADAVETVLAAVYVSSLAGDLAAQKLGMRSMVASDIREHLSEAIRLLDPEGELPS